MDFREYRDKKTKNLFWECVDCHEASSDLVFRTLHRCGVPFTGLPPAVAAAVVVAPDSELGRTTPDVEADKVLDEAQARVAEALTNFQMLGQAQALHEVRRIIKGREQVTRDVMRKGAPASSSMDAGRREGRLNELLEILTLLDSMLAAADDTLTSVGLSRAAGS